MEVRRRGKSVTRLLDRSARDNCGGGDTEFVVLEESDSFFCLETESLVDRLCVCQQREDLWGYVHLDKSCPLIDQS